MSSNNIKYKKVPLKYLSNKRALPVGSALDNLNINTMIQLRDEHTGSRSCTQL